MMGHLVVSLIGMIAIVYGLILLNMKNKGAK
jgi:hypothetical protein